MEEKKYIDRLYQEKFKDFDAAPREELWNNIAAKLKQNNRKQSVLLPLWSKLAGAAAVLLLALLLGDWFNPLVKPSVVSIEDEVLKSDQEEKTRLTTVAEEKMAIDKELIAPSKKNIQALQQDRNIPSEISTITTKGIKQYSSETKHISLLNSTTPPKESHTPKTNSIAEAVRENSLNSKIVATAPETRLEVSTHAAPIYYGNLKKGNFIDSRFNNNSSQGEVTYSYGIKLAYNISEKLKIRSGISKVSMSHNTSEIAFQSVLNPRALASVDYRDDLNLQVMDGAITWKGSPDPIANSFKSTIDNISQGLLNQKLGFIEVPLEVEYVLIDSKFGLNIIGGASTLFLDENSISIASGDIATVLGRANNLNEISFSTNIGLGLDYKITKSFLLNLEPMFKYQINTFNAATGTYQPYYIGVYSGFSYKF